MKTSKEWISEIHSAHNHSTPECVCERCKDGLESFLIPSDIDKIKTDALRWAAHSTSLYLEKNRLHPDIPNEHLNQAASMAAHSVLQQAALAIMIEVEKIESEPK